jgi:N-acetylglucosamine-6-phosphate deacetylase
MEGPFLSEQKRGSQGKTNLRDPDGAFFRELQEICGGMIRIVDVAPELPGALQFCQEASKDCTVSAAHTAATYEQARRLYEAGASHLTHLLHAMTPFHHRAPGVIGAASEKEKVTAELIADNHHVHPSAVRMAFRMFPERICLVSDALRCCGMPEGEYELAGQLVQMQDGVARMLDGTIAGAASDLMEDLRNVIIYGIPIRQAINAATIIPARAAGWSNMVGSIEEGKYADLLICDPGLAIRQVMIGGEYI